MGKTCLLFLYYAVAPLYLAAFRRDKGKMQVMRQAVDEPNWYYKIVGNFAFPSKDELNAPITTTVGKLNKKS